MLYMKFSFDWPREGVFKNIENDTDNDDDTRAYPVSAPISLGSGELKQTACSRVQMQVIVALPFSMHVPSIYTGSFHKFNT